MNGDGVLDYAVGGNAVRVFSGANGAVLLGLDQIGPEVDFITDIDGDGVTDLLVGDATTRQVRVVSGSTGLILPFSRRYDVGYDEGESIAVIGDVNSDLVSDFAVGSEGNYGGAKQTAVYSGKTNGLLTLVGSGHSVAALGDVDGDGRGDFVAGRNRDIAIFSGWPGDVLHAIPGEDAVLAGCDVDGDGIKDALLSMPRVANDSLYALVVSYSGSTGALIDSVTAFTEPLGNIFFFRGFVAGVGDVDGDGHEDFAESFAEATYRGLAEAGVVAVFSGATGERLVVVGGSAPGMHFGWSVDGPGDIDGDGVPDLIVGAPDGSEPGRVYVYRLKRGALSPRLEFDPGTCPNRVPTKGNQELELAFLGGGEFDLAELDASTVRLDGIAPTREKANAADVDAVDGASCTCANAARDGLADRVFRFDADEVRAHLPLGRERELAVTARLGDGTMVEGSVCALLARRTNGVHLNDGTALVAWPNPVPRGGAIQFHFPVAADLVEPLTVHDVRGRRIAVVHLLNGRAEWDTRDEQGVLVPAGVYLVSRPGEPGERISVVGN